MINLIICFTSRGFCTSRNFQEAHFLHRDSFLSETIEVKNRKSEIKIIYSSNWAAHAQNGF